MAPLFGGGTGEEGESMVVVAEAESLGTNKSKPRGYIPGWI